MKRCFSKKSSNKTKAAAVMQRNGTHEDMPSEKDSSKPTMASLLARQWQERSIVIHTLHCCTMAAVAWKCHMPAKRGFRHYNIDIMYG